MGKFFLIFLLWRLTGNPILAIVVILVIYYFIDRRYIGLLPSVVKPFRRQRQISNLRRSIAGNPHDMPSRFNLAQAYIERRQFQRALELLRQLSPTMQETADVKYHIGLCQLATNHLTDGEKLVLEALAMDRRLRYGEPYLKLATAVAPTNPNKALEYIREFQSLNYSSCESDYKMGLLYKELGDAATAKSAWRKCVETYRTLPKFRKRVERRWALAARRKLVFL